MAETSRRSGRPLVFSMFTHELVPTIHTRVLEWTDEERAAGARIRPMFNPRAVLSLFGLDGLSPVRASAWKALYDRPPGERLAALEDETVRRSLLDVPPHTDERIGTTLSLFGPDSCDYERDPERRLDRIAARRGERPVETVVALLRETHGRQLFASAGSNQVPAHIEEVLDYRDTLIGLGDAGAHVTGICDSSLTTHTLTYWCRERGKLGLEEAVRRLTSDPADAFGIPERGRLAPGMRLPGRSRPLDPARPGLRLHHRQRPGRHRAGQSHGAPRGPALAWGRWLRSSVLRRLPKASVEKIGLGTFDARKTELLNQRPRGRRPRGRRAPPCPGPRRGRAPRALRAVH
jgi:hypothetical protein